jgi:ABC-2 type transport system permease protein
VTGKPGSTLWLLGWELRLAWRNALGRRGGRGRLVLLGIAALASLGFGVPLALLLRRVETPINPFTILAADAGMLVVFTLMLSQTLAGAIEALYTRGDLDLLFSSPLDPRKTLTVRFLALATSAFLAFATFTLPFLLPIALLGHWRWLALLPALAAVALAASAVGLALAVGLFRLIGPRRTRAVAQILAAFIGAIFFLTSQTRNLFGARASNSLWAQVGQAASDPSLRLPPLASWPLRAVLGEPLPLLALIALGAGLFFAVSAWLGRRFAADAAAAQGAAVSQPRVRHAPAAPFASGPFAATFIKEVRLLRRDIALIAQVLLRVFYMLPAAFLLLRNAAGGVSLFLPGGAAFLVVMVGQVAGSLTWITVSAEDAPELLLAAPAPPAVIRRAKLAAGLTPLAVLLAPLMLVLIAYAPLVGIASSLGAAAAALAAGMINAWRPAPGKRSEFRRRRTGAILTGWMQFIVSLLIAAATALMALGSVFALFALAPAILAALALLALRRSDAQIAEAFAANA